MGLWLRRRAENVAAAMLAVMFTAFILQIIFRYFFNFRLWPFCIFPVWVIRAA